jgi:ribosomal protein S18 acetylase RimI-like enzyme
MAVTIEPMTLDDYDDVLALWQSVEGVGLHLADADSREGIAAYLLRNPEMSLVAREDTRVVGAVLCGHDGRRGYLHHLAVHTDYRGQGIGCEMMQTCLASLSEAGLVKCTIMVYTDNTDGQAFWEKHGWWKRDNLLCMQTWAAPTPT